MAKRVFGWLRKLPSKRWQASYTGPDGGRHKGHTTFLRRSDAEAWLAAEEKLIDEGAWTPPASRDPYAVAKQSMTLADYIEQTIQAREKRSRKPLKPSTAAAYRQVARLVITPTLGDHDLASLTPQAVRAWWSELPGDKPTRNGHAYNLLRSVLNDAVDEGLLAANPCKIKGRGSQRQTSLRHQSEGRLDAAGHAGTGINQKPSRPES